MRGRRESVMFLAAVLMACGTPAVVEDASDGDADAGPPVSDSGRDAGRDAAVDGGADAGPGCDCNVPSACCDGCLAQNEGGACTNPIPGTGGEATCADGSCVGQPCACSSGPCCDGCFFRPATYQCATDVLYASRCVTIGETACPGYTDRISESFGNQFCQGDRPDCTGSIEHVRDVSRLCWTMDNPIFCVEDSAPPIAAHCAHTCASP